MFTNWLSYSWFATSEQQCDNISKKCLNAALFNNTIAVQTVNDQIIFLVFFFPKCIELCLFFDPEQSLFEGPIMRSFLIYHIIMAHQYSVNIRLSCVPV